VTRQSQNKTIHNLCMQAGADLTQQGKVFHRGGAVFRELARRSKAGIPTVSVVCGSSTAGNHHLI